MSSSYNALPRDEQAEQSVLGIALAFPDALVRLSDCALKVEHFTSASHREIWAAIDSMAKRRQPIDIVTVNAHLAERGKAESAGGLEYLNALSGSVASSLNVVRHAEIVVERALCRAIIEAAEQAQAIAREPGGADQKLDRVASLFAAIQRPGGSEPEPVSIGTAMLDRVEHWEALEKGEVLGGMPTHLPTLDSALGGGLKAGTVVTLAARPSIGKTSLATQILLNIAADGSPVFLVSQEMGKGDLVDRAAANLGRVDLGAIVSGRFKGDDWSRLTEAAEAATPLPFYIDDRPALTLLDIRAAARRVQKRHGLKVLAIDYLQLCGTASKQDTRHHQIEQLSRGLKQLSKELGVCVLLLSQVTRQSTQRADGEPTLSDLKESGAIEEDADVVAFLHPKGNLPDGSMLVAAILAKNRQGRRGRIALSFAGATQRWVESTADVSASGRS